MSDQELGIFQTLKSGSQFHVFSQIPQNKTWIEPVWIEKNHYENEVNRMSAGQTKHFPQIKTTDSFLYIHTKGWNIENSFWGKAKNVELQGKKKLIKPLGDTFHLCESLLRTMARREKSWNSLAKLPEDRCLTSCLLEST